MVNYSQWHTERSTNKKVHAIEEINVLSGKMDDVTSQIFNLECYTLDHHCISYFIAFWLDPSNSTQLKDPRRDLGISLFSYLSFLKF